MSETYLNGRVTFTSLATPSEEDMRLMSNLTESERRQVLKEALEKGCASPLSTKSLQDIWEEAKAANNNPKRRHAL